MTRLVVLDNEAIAALANPHHPKHRTALGYLELVKLRKKRAVAISILAPTAVRVEAGWDRNAAQWAFLNRLRISDVVLDTACANKAAGIREQAHVSVADAHIGAAVQSASDADITVVTSDPEDITAYAATLGHADIAIEQI